MDLPAFESNSVDEIQNHRPNILHRGLLKETNSEDCYQLVACDSRKQVATAPTLYQPIFMRNFEPVPQLQQSCLQIPYGTISAGCQGEIIFLKQERYPDKFNDYNVPHEAIDGNSNVQHLVSGTEQQSLFSFAPMRGACTSSPQLLCEDVKENVMNESLTTITWLGHMDAQKLVPCTSNLPMRHRQLERGRPPYSYMALIQFAINSSPSRRMTLRQIYNWIEERFPYFKHAKPGWKNSIRHNLSLHDIFVREVSPVSKASYWTIHADLDERPLTLDCVAKMPFGHLEEITEINRNQGLQQCSLVPTDSSTHESLAKSSSLATLQLSPIQPKLTDENSYSVSSLASFLISDNNDAPAQKRLVHSGVQNEPQFKKKRRKQPLKTMNDSLNDSLHFNDTLSKSPSTSPSSPGTGYPPDGGGDTSEESGLGASFRKERLQPAPSSRATKSESHSTVRNVTISSAMKPDPISESMPSTSDVDTALEDCLPQIFDGDTFEFNSSFSRFLNANATSLFNNSTFSACDFSDIDDANQQGKS